MYISLYQRSNAPLPLYSTCFPNYPNYHSLTTIPLILILGIRQTQQFLSRMLADKVRNNVFGMLKYKCKFPPPGDMAGKLVKSGSL